MSHSIIFHSYEDVTITGEELRIFTNIRHSSPLSSEGSLACHIYCDHEASVYNCHLRGHVTLTPVAKRLAMELSLFLRLRSIGLSRLGFEHQTFHLRGQRSNRLRHRGGTCKISYVNIQHTYVSMFTCNIVKRDNYVDARLKLCCMSTYLCCMLI